MLELLHPLAALIALTAVAAAMFARPEGALGWCGFGALFAALGAGAVWRAGAGVSAELTALFAYFVAGALVALVLMAAVLARHALNALGARALF